jgi:putative endonuclease
MPGAERRIVYILRSQTTPRRHYVGITANVRVPLEWHNDGSCRYTVQDRPWSIIVSMEFASEKAAREFAKYLKSGSGRAFSKRHFSRD